MTGPLNQLKITFDPVEDRLLLSMTAGQADALVEYQILLTRRFVRLFWQVLEQMLQADISTDPRITPINRDAVMKFKQEAALAQADFSTPYSTKTPLTPLGTKPLLVSKMQARKGPEGKQTLSLQTQNGQAINLAMNTTLIHSIRKLLADAVKKAEWDLPFSLLSDTAVSPAEIPRKMN